MKINEVERITGLSQKAIRLYENKGLVCVSRDQNGYRNYSAENVETLKSIKLFRSIGISLTDIKLYLFGVINLEEMIDKRKAEIRKESGQNSEQYRFCEQITEKMNDVVFNTKTEFIENAGVDLESCGALAVGIDIGTTTISAVVLDIDNKKQVEAFTLPHRSYICSDVVSEQSTVVILEKAEKLLHHILKSYQDVVSIGISGQMHGIVYLDPQGVPVSNLINWQDKRADQMLPNGETACQRIMRVTGEKIATGYGLATHYSNLLSGNVPEGASSFCSIMDLFAMKICGLQKAIVHTSVAASFGLFDVKEERFQKEKLFLLGMEETILPEVTGESAIIGYCNGIPVSVAIGDNQASVLGSVKDNSSGILVNIGTGSQISAVSEYCDLSEEIELRPFIEGKFLICGAALCGGFAYSMLETFFRSYAASAGMQDVSQYNILNDLAAQAYENGKQGLQVDVSFCGKRSDPNCRGSIQMIGRHNFTPPELILGVLKGMCGELYELYEAIPQKRSNLVASGGAVRKNKVLQKLLADQFGVPVFVNAGEEEAATGAALFSAFAIGKIAYQNGFPEYICYGE